MELTDRAIDNRPFIALAGSQDGFLDGGDDVPDMTIDIDLVAGEIIVREAA